jgi:hypothetical protein
MHASAGPGTRNQEKQPVRRINMKSAFNHRLRVKEQQLKGCSPDSWYLVLGSWEGA